MSIEKLAERVARLSERIEKAAAGGRPRVKGDGDGDGIPYEGKKPGAPRRSAARSKPFWAANVGRKPPTSQGEYLARVGRLEDKLRAVPKELRRQNHKLVSDAVNDVRDINANAWAKGNRLIAAERLAEARFGRGDFVG
jgi:hypothetical protein